VQCFAKGGRSLRAGMDQPGSPDKPSEFTCFEDRISLLAIIKFPVSGKKGIKRQTLETIEPFCPVRMMKTVTARQAKYEFRPRDFSRSGNAGAFSRNEANPGFLLLISNTCCRIITVNCAKWAKLMMRRNCSSDGGNHGASKHGNKFFHGTGAHERFMEPHRPTRAWNDRKLGAEGIGSVQAGTALHARTGPEMPRKTKIRWTPSRTLTPGTSASADRCELIARVH
jgi:hypothetical protein